MKQLMFPDDQQFGFETLRTLGLAVYGGSDVGEVIATASRVTSGDYDGWHDAWLSTAERLDTEARASHPVSARDGLLRASTYYRAAEFFLHGYFYRAAGAGPKPTLVMHNGFDGARRGAALLRRRRRAGTRLSRPDLRRTRAACGHPPERAVLPAGLGERGRPGPGLPHPRPGR
ncbi:hypothetical protein [Spirillospora sp. NPDC047279]|uniref:hypothetical protein n=1 Tax=Spirillospora sp. NPDC047279 TaxID=3155478 RepID=UPI0033D8FB84